MSHPWLGQGPGQARVHVLWTDLEGNQGVLLDPHSAWLSLLSQGGLVALGALAWLTLRKPGGRDSRLAWAVAVALWIDGLTGSFETARYLWVAIGALEAQRGEER